MAPTRGPGSAHERIFRVRSPSGEQRLVVLTGPELRIGSALDSSLVLEGVGVSAHHCRISERGRGLVVVDERSRNGTYINSRRCIGPTELHVGDRLFVGEYVLELLPTRAASSPLPPRAAFEALRLDQDEAGRRAAELARFSRYAREWTAAGRPRRLLLRPRQLAALAALRDVARIVDPQLAALVAASASDTRRRRWLGLVLGAALVAATALALAWPARRAAPPRATTQSAETRRPPPPDAPRNPLEQIRHTIRSEETYEDIAHYYKVSLALIERWNGVSTATAPAPGTELVVWSTEPPRPPLQEERHIVEPGEDWRSIADGHGVTVRHLRQHNPALGDLLRGGEELRLFIEAEPFAAPNIEGLPIFIVPGGTSSQGKPYAGALFNAVQLVPSPLADVRCASHAYGTKYTVENLLRAIADLRAQGYRGQLMVGDLSRRTGGQFGPHKSHQSGRDVDVWLPVTRKAYRRGCNNCSTEFCRPDPDEVDWAATWRLVAALDQTGAVELVFLAHHLHEKLYRAARRQGAGGDELRRMIQWPRPPGVPAVVMHSDGHIHHIHVRFKCDPQDDACWGAR